MAGGLARVTTDDTLRQDLERSAAVRGVGGLTRDQVDLVKRTIAKGASDDELALFVQQCNRTGLDPFSKQIYWIKRGGNASIQVSIDGFRVIADRSGELDGQEVHWCGPDGAWVDVWLAKEPPAASRVLVYRKGCQRPFPGVARWAEYNAGGNMWSKMPATMIAKCAESLALRKAFPQELSGLYTTDEMGQAEGAPERLESMTTVAPQRITLPEGTSQILRVVPQTNGKVTWADITYVTAAGEEKTCASGGDTKAALVSLAEQMASNGDIVELTTRVNRNGKTVIDTLQRYQPEPALAGPVFEVEPAL